MAFDDPSLQILLSINSRLNFAITCQSYRLLFYDESLLRSDQMLIASVLETSLNSEKSRYNPQTQQIFQILRDKEEMKRGLFFPYKERSLCFY